MKNSTRFTLTAAATIILTASGFSQKALKKADAAFESHQYFSAVTLYKQVYQSVPKDKKGLVLYRTGVASEEINDYKGAETYYQKAIATGIDDPKVYLRLAEVLKVQFKYAEAMTEFKNYKAKGGDAKRADIGVKSCELAQQWKDNPRSICKQNYS